MNSPAIFSVCASLLCLIVSGISFYTRKTPSHVALGFTTLFVGVWSLFPFLTTVIADPSLKLSVARVLYMFAGLAPFSFLYLTLSVLGPKFSNLEKSLINITKVLGVIFAVLALYPFYIRDVGMNG